MTKLKIKDEQVKLLSGIIQIEESLINMLINKGIICKKGIRSILIEEEYRNMLEEENINKGNLVSILMKKYNLSRSTIEKIIYNNIKI